MMEVKIKIPALFARYRVVKMGDFFYSQKRESLGWKWLDGTNYAWSDSNKECATKHKNLEEAITHIEKTKIKVVWRGW